MRKVTSTLIAAAVAVLPVSIGYTFSHDFIESAMVQACQDVKNNNVMKLKRNLKKNYMSTSLISEKLMCNGESVYDFALTHEANKTANLLRTGSVSIQDLSMNNQDKYWIWID